MQQIKIRRLRDFYDYAALGQNRRPSSLSNATDFYVIPTVKAVIGARRCRQCHRHRELESWLDERAVVGRAVQTNRSLQATCAVNKKTEVR